MMSALIVFVNCVLPGLSSFSLILVLFAAPLLFLLQTARRCLQQTPKKIELKDKANKKKQIKKRNQKKLQIKRKKQINMQQSATSKQHVHPNNTHKDSRKAPKEKE